MFHVPRDQNEFNPLGQNIGYSQNTQPQTQPFNKYCGFWHDSLFREFYRKDISSWSPLSINEPPFQTLKIFGDSMGRHFYESLVANHSLCKSLFKKCDLSYTWVYKMYNRTQGFHDGVHIYDGKDFNQTHYLEDIRRDLYSKDMQHDKSVYLINFGVHTIMTLPLYKLRELLQAFFDVISDMKKRLGPSEITLIIWKSTTYPILENFKPSPSTQLRFLTKQVCAQVEIVQSYFKVSHTLIFSFGTGFLNQFFVTFKIDNVLFCFFYRKSYPFLFCRFQRVRYWNSYSHQMMKRRQIPILDVTTMAMSYPWGPYDIMHYNNLVFKQAEDDLQTFVIERLSKKETLRSKWVSFVH